MMNQLYLFISVVVMVQILRKPRFLIDIFFRQSRVLFYIDTKLRIVALTIDDGPFVHTTTQILDVLHEFNAHATFFLISNNIQDNEELVHRMIQEHHEIGNHLTEDYPSILLSREDFHRKLIQADQSLRSFCVVNWFRPANAFYRDYMIRFGRSLNYQCVLGDILPLDVILRSSRIVVYYILAVVRPGSIITLHDGARYRSQTPQTLKALLTTLTRRGYQVVTVTELVQAGRTTTFHD